MPTIIPQFEINPHIEESVRFLNNAMFDYEGIFRLLTTKGDVVDENSTNPVE